MSDLGVLYDGPHDGRVWELTGPLDVPPLSRAEMIDLASYEQRQDLERSSLYARLRPRIAQLSGALIYQSPEQPPRAPDHPLVRVASWNIERGARLEGVKAVLAENPDLSQADIILLNEVDMGMARTGNRDIALELARRLDMHMVFGNGYLALGHGGRPDPREDNVNLRGLHGNAILSRLPLARAEVFSVPVVSDRFGCPDRRLGHKKALWVEVTTPLGPLTVAAVHLDSNTSPAGRGWQMRGVLRHLLGRRPNGPLLLGGDLNTSTLDFRSMQALCLDLARKLPRGGPRGILRGLLHPERRHERPVFQALEREGLAWRELNQEAEATCRFEVEELEDACMVMSFPPAPVIRAGAWYLRILGGVAGFKLDWFAGRGVHPVGEPKVIRRPTHGGHRVSDHDPIMVDIAW